MIGLKPVAPNTKRRSFWHGWPVSMLVLGLLWMIGCNGGKTPEPDDATTQTASAREMLQKKRLCSESFAKAYQILTPEPSNVDTELQSAQDILNQWLASCAEFSGLVIPADYALLSGIADEAALNELNAKTASQRDVLYLRDQLLMRAMVEQITAGIPTDVAKVRAIFDSACLLVSLDGPLISDYFQKSGMADPAVFAQLDERTIPRSLQDICLSGRGTADDRLWLFAALLGQLNVDVIVLDASSTADDDDPRLGQLVVVALQDQYFLFSPGLGFELHSERGHWNADELKQNWNTLFSEQIAAALAVDSDESAESEPKPPAIDFSEAKILLPRSWLLISPRMEALQLELIGDSVCEIFDSPVETSERQGLQTELDAAYGPLFEQFAPKFWEYPDQMYEQVVSQDEATQLLRNLYLATLFKEVQSLRSSENENEQKVVKASLEKRMLMARIDHLTGTFQPAISTYMKLRLQGGIAGQSSEVAIENLLRFAQAEDALYWTAVTQYEMGDFSTAAETLRNYLDRYRQGRWEQSARELLMWATYRDGDADEAATLLEQTEPTMFDRIRYRQMLKQSRQSPR